MSKIVSMNVEAAKADFSKLDAFVQANGWEPIENGLALHLASPIEPGSWKALTKGMQSLVGADAWNFFCFCLLYGPGLEEWGSDTMLGQGFLKYLPKLKALTVQFESAMDLAKMFSLLGGIGVSHAEVMQPSDMQGSSPHVLLSFSLLNGSQCSVKLGPAIIVQLMVELKHFADTFLRKLAPSEDAGLPLELPDASLKNGSMSPIGFQIHAKSR